jgi:O-antigen ligase
LRARFEANMAGNRERVVMWESAWAMFKDRPLTGFGMGDTAQYTPIYAARLLGHRAEFTSHAHNNLLDQVAATGLLGLAAFLFWWGVLFVEAWRCFRRGPADERWLPAAALAAFLAFQVNGLTQVNFWDGKSQHTLMLWAGVTLAISLRRKRRELSGRA